MKMVTTVCFGCKREFEKPKNEYDRRIRNHQKIFCGHSCAGTYSNLISPRKGSTIGLKANNKLDKFSPFRYYRNKARSTERVKLYGDSNLTLEYLNTLWGNQRGRCPYTGKLMELPRTTKEQDIKATPNRASLDRIDSSKGYVQGNVEFVCYAINLAKNCFSREQMMDFFQKS